ncbi:MAG TPA: ribosome-associated translation inhibitor RaiA [Bdellovibrionota bacterium]|jgi:putative sigma-54 modulation protein|nr:ribosome-associated translation inhibitor RaiA [Bdellovibrionota bacterium]
MQVQVSFQHTKTSAAMRERATDLAERLGRYFKGRITVGWHFAKEGNRCVAHCHVTGNHMDYFAEAQDMDDNFYAAMDACLDRMERQIRKRKETVRDHLHRGSLKRAAAIGAIALVAGLSGRSEAKDDGATFNQVSTLPNTNCQLVMYTDVTLGRAWRGRSPASGNTPVNLTDQQTDMDWSEAAVDITNDDGNGHTSTVHPGIKFRMERIHVPQDSHDWTTRLTAEPINHSQMQQFGTCQQTSTHPTPLGTAHLDLLDNGHAAQGNFCVTAEVDGARVGYTFHCTQPPSPGAAQARAAEHTGAGGGGHGGSAGGSGH